MVSLEPDSLVGLVAVGTLPAAALAGLFVGSTAAAVVAVVGWLLLVPTLGILADDEEFSFGSEEEEQESASDPLETLRSRYARGELTELEFERRLEHLLETEDVELPPGASLNSEPVEGGSEPVEAGWRDSEPVESRSKDSSSADAPSTTHRREENAALEETDER